MLDEKIMKEIYELVEDTRDIIVCSIGEQGYPNAKAMFKVSHEELKTFYFSTNVSSNRTQQFMKNSKACLYFCGSKKINGLMLIGDMEILLDKETKQRFWQDGWEMYYPLGATDPDYCIAKFTSISGNYYNSLKKYIFRVE
jgi:general stress protein 26